MDNLTPKFDFNFDAYKTKEEEATTQPLPTTPVAPQRQEAPAQAPVAPTQRPAEPTLRPKFDFKLDSYATSKPMRQLLVDNPPSAEEMAAVRERLPVYQTPEKAAGVDMSPTQLRNDPESMKNIREHMAARYGAGVSLLTGEGYSYDPKQSDDEVFDMYMNKMRRFNAGQSVVVLNELAYLNNASDEDVAKAARAYDTFDQLGGVFNDNYTWSETFDGMGDYVRAVVIDPTNLIGLGVGGAVTKLSAKGATTAIKAMAREMAAGAVTRAAKQAGTKGLSEAAQNQVFAQTYQRAIEKAIGKASIQQGLRREAIAGNAIGAVTESGLSMGVEAAYQETQRDTGRQEGTDWLAYGLVGLSGAVTFGAGTAIATMTKLSPPTMLASKYTALDKPEYNLAAAAANVNAKQVALDLDFNLKAYVDNPPEMGAWEGKKAIGSGLQATRPEDTSDLEVDFFAHMILGNEKAGVKGLLESMADAGLRRVGTRGVNDNITNYVADVMKYLPDEYKDQMTASFRATVGSRIPKYENYTTDEFLNLFAKKVSDAGRMLNIMSQTSNRLRTKLSAAQLVEGVAPPPKGPFKDALDRVGYIQSNLVRAIVTHPGTTMLNLTGGISYGGFEIAKDVVKASLYGGKAGFNMLMGKSAADPWNTARAIVKSQQDKFSNLVNPYATYDEFMSYMSVRSEPREKLARYLSGSDEKLTGQDAIDAFGFDPQANVLSRGLEKGLDFFQGLYGAKLADNFLKSQSFMFHIEQGIRVKYGVSYRDFVNGPDAYRIMNSPEYLKLEANAVEETLRSTFGKSYADHGLRVSEAFSKNFITGVATAVEEVRKVPGLGAAFPFGRFFNNTIAFMSDVSLVPAIAYKAMGKDDRPWDEIISRGAAGLALMGLGASREVDFLNQGLAWYESRADDGSITDSRYDYPQSYFKFINRMLAYKLKGEDIPDDFKKEFIDTFGSGQLSRSFGGGSGNSAGIGIEDYIFNLYNVVVEDGLGSGIMELVGDTISQYVSGFTRFLDPVNHLAALTMGKDYEVIDRKQGHEVLNNSLRYVDNIFESVISNLSGEETQLAPPKRTITREGDLGQNPSAVMAYRESAPTTYAQRILNATGIQGWTMEASGKDPAANARLNEMAAFFAEREARKLWENPAFATMNTAKRRQAVAGVFTRARDAARETLMSSFGEADNKAALIYELTGPSVGKETLDNALRSSGLEGTELSDMNMIQLELLKEWVEVDKNAVDVLLENR